MPEKEETYEEEEASTRCFFAVAATIEIAK